MLKNNHELFQEHQGAPDNLGHAHEDAVMHPDLKVKTNHIPEIHTGVPVGGKPPVNVKKVHQTIRKGF